MNNGSDSASRQVHVAFSGGGIRAANMTNGANVALFEAVSEGEVEVKSMTCVSGSSLAVARLLVAGSNLPDDTPPIQRHAALLDEVEAVWRHGFKWAWRWDYLLWLVFAPAVMWASLILPASLGLNPQPSTPSLVFFVALGVIVSPLAAVLFRRVAPFNINRKSQAARRNKRMHQRRWRGAEQPIRQAPLLPTDDIAFLSVNLNTAETCRLDPWAAYEDSADPKKQALPIGGLAHASSAFPFYASAVNIDNDFHVDGGVLDNLGAVSAATKVEAGQRLLVVDASVPLSEHARFETKTWTSTSGLLWYSAKLIAVIAALTATGVVAARRFDAVFSPALVATIVYLAFMIGVFRPLASQLWDTVTFGAHKASVEFRSLAVIQARQREVALRELNNSGISFTLVELPARLPPPTRESDLHTWKPDLATKLTQQEAETGRQLILHAYKSTRRELGLKPRAETVAAISSWTPRRRANVLSSSLSLLPSLGKAILVRYVSMSR